MTGIQAIELIRQHHPDISTGECIILLNEGQKDFCRKTNIYKTSYTQTTTAGQRYYTLDDNILDIKEVHFNDVAIPRLIGKPVIDDDEFLSGTNQLAVPNSSSNDRYWYLDTRRIGIVEKSTGRVVSRDDKSTQYQSCSVTGQELRLLVTAYPTEFTQVNISTNVVLSLVPGSFERAIVDYVIANGYMLPANFQPPAVQLFSAKYAEGVKDGKKFSNKSAGGTGRIVPCEF
tara:strand:+ start:2242 stop:2934 length:693 start_codon:yes stop_codon:yes gene_type:complete